MADTKFSALPENTNPQAADFTTNDDGTNLKKTKWQTVVYKIIGPLLYPVGSLYFNYSDSTNPGTLLGFGTWSAVGVGRFIVGAGTSDETFNAGDTGGESTHTLSTNELPVHQHAAGSLTANSNGNHAHSYDAWRQGTYPGGSILGGGYLYGNPPISTGSTTTTGAHTHSISGSTDNAGGGDSHNNLPPYEAVYAWRRTA